MELTLQLRKRRHEPWGFRLVGGSEYGVPLTIVKVVPRSPASHGGLRDGDALRGVGGRRAAGHEAAHEDIGKAEADGVLELEVYRRSGRYDAILDDQEVVFEPYEPEDFAPQSEPTEVFLPIDPIAPAPELRDQPDRSLTASPFILPTKPYRPFSAEPIPEIPPIEDPIILNPDYHDEFGATEDGYPLKTKFKLPISEQYDPDGTGQCKRTIVQKECVSEQTYVSESFEMKSEIMTVEETKFMEQMKIDIDLDKIEMTAATVVDDSISKGLNVTEEIKNEVTVELQTSKVLNDVKTSELLELTKKCLNESVISEIDTALTATSANVMSINQSGLTENVTQSKKDIDTCASTINKNSVNQLEQRAVTEEAFKTKTKLEQIDSNEKTQKDDSVTSQTKQEIEEIISKGSVKRLSASFDNESAISKSDKKNVESGINKAIETKNKDLKQHETTSNKEQSSSVRSASSVQNATKETATTSGRTTVKADASCQKSSATKQTAGQRAFTIGLQTIPNIRGQVQSSYHYDLLLRTFFIHLTDVMVALSRFILTEPIISKQVTSQATENVGTEEKTVSVNEVNVINKEESYVENTNKDLAAGADFGSEVIVQQQSELLQVDAEHEVITKHKSGLEMAQLSSHKSEELTHKMDAVISEFQTKSGVDETAISSDIDKTSNVIEQTSTEKKEELRNEVARAQVQEIQQTTECLSSTNSQTLKKEQTLQTLEREEMLKSTEMKTESILKDKKSKRDRQTYVAVVESHTYTNKDTIFEEHFSGTSSLQSPEVAVVADSTFFESNVQTKKDVSNITNIESEQVAIEANESVKLSQEIVSSKTLEIVEQANSEMDLETSVVLPRKLSLKETINEDAQATVQVFKEIEVPYQTKYESDTKIEKTELHTFQSADISSSQLQQSSEIKTVGTKEVSVQKPDRNLTLDLEKTDVHKKLHKISPSNSIASTISTPTPMTVPPTPLTDEYIFRLECPMPPDRGETPLPEEPSPEKEIDHEDLTIVKKKLNPYIETTIERVVYDPPLPSPVDVTDVSSFALQGVVDVVKDAGQMTQEEILEIERKSSLLTSAIDETIKNIEEYKEQVAMKETALSTDKTTEMLYKGFVTEAKTTVFSDAIDSFNQTKLDTEITASNHVKFDEKVAVINTTSAVEMKDTSNETNGIKVSNINEFIHQEKSLQGYRPIVFNPEEKIEAEKNLPGFRSVQLSIENQPQQPRLATPRRVEIDGELLGSKQGFIGGLQETVMNEQVAKELGKPGITEEKIAEIMSGESEMLREAHVMGLSRVLSSHMNKPDDSSVDFNKIKPTIDKLKDSEVLKALNDELTKTKAEKKKDDRKWTTFLQRPQRAVPNAKFGYHGYLPQFDPNQEPYRVKIVKQPKPKVAPDFKPAEDFETGLLPWEERARNEPPPPPIVPEDPILIPEEAPEFLEAIDPLPESEVPDLEDTGIPLPPEKTDEIPEVTEIAESSAEEEIQAEPEVEKEEDSAEGDQRREEEDENMEEKLLHSVQSMVDPNAPLEQQLAQMRAQLAALAQLPGIIQQSLELVTSQLVNMTQQETTKVVTETETAVEICEKVEVKTTEIVEESNEEHIKEVSKVTESETVVNGIPVIEQQDEINPEDVERVKKDQEIIMEQQRKIEQQRKELMDQMQIELESRQVKQHPTPRVGKPKPMFGPLVPMERPLVLPGGRKWRKPKDAYNDQFISETLTAQAEIIKGKAKGSYESVLLPYDERVNFLKYEKPPVSLEHLQHSETYRLVHEPDSRPMRRVDMLTPVIAECDYRERCRSQTPGADLKAQMQP